LKFLHLHHAKYTEMNSKIEISASDCHAIALGRIPLLLLH
jgi:hypothetical protein